MKCLYFARTVQLVIFSIASVLTALGNANEGINLGTLPILYINTEDSVDIISKDYYVEAKCWMIDSNGESILGSVDEPIPMRIKGRGNATWRNADKKPFRIQFNQKQEFLGLNRNKNFVLLTGVDDGGLGFLKYPVGFELSRRIGLGWTPEIRHIELIINGSYNGLYFLIEKIRVDKERINIIEQNDGEEDAYAVTGGWLLELDNLNDDQQIVIKETDNKQLRCTWHSPDSLSEVQKDFLVEYMTKCNAAIYTDDKSSTEWESYIDIESLVKYYIINEVLDNREAFHGSCYLYKDRGNNTKLHFGPIWDLGAYVYSAEYHQDCFIYESNPFGMNWIGEIVKFPRFQQAVRKQWQVFCDKTNTDELEQSVVGKLQQAAVNNYNRWPNQCGALDLTTGKNKFDDRKKRKISYLNKVWGKTDGVARIDNVQNLKDDYFTLSGIRIMDNAKRKGLYISKGKKMIVK